MSGTDLGQSPDVAFDGSKLLVIYDGNAGNTLAAVSLDGQILWKEEVGGIQGPRVTWNPALGLGLAAVDSGLRWLGADGKPVGTFLSTQMEGSWLAGDVCATSTGFVVLYGAAAYSTPPGLAATILGPQPTNTVTWQPLAAGSPRGAADHANGVDGLAQYAVSAAIQGGIGDLWEVKADQLPTMLTSIGSLLPADGAGFAVGLVQQGGHFYLLWSGAPPPQNYAWTQWVVDLTDGTSKKIDKSGNSTSGHMIKLGETIVIASPAIVTPEAVNIGRYDPVDGVVKDLVALATVPHTSHSPRMINTSIGFAVVWNEATGDTDGLSAFLTSFDCCPMTK